MVTFQPKYLTKTIIELWAFNLFDFTLNRLAELANQIPVILDMINKMTGNSSALSAVISMEAQLAYQTYTIQQFIIKQLQLFNGKCFRSLRYHLILSSFKKLQFALILYCEDLSGKCNDFVSDSTHITLTTYFNSPELTRLLNQISDSPEMSGVLFRTLVNIMYDPQKVRAFNLIEFKLMYFYV